MKILLRQLAWLKTGFLKLSLILFLLFLAGCKKGNENPTAKVTTILPYGSINGIGFDANSGSIMLVNGSSSQTIVNGLSMPAGLKQINDNSWYVKCMEMELF